MCTSSGLRPAGDGVTTEIRHRQWKYGRLQAELEGNFQRIGYGFEFSVNSQKRAERFAARFPVGTELNVYYQPDQPSYAILVRDNSPQPTWIAFGIGLFLGLLPLLLYIYGRLTGYKPPEN